MQTLNCALFLETFDRPKVASAKWITISLCLLVVSGASAAGVGWEGGITAIYQDSDDNRADAEFTGSADLFLTLPGERGEWLLYVEASTAPKANGISAYYPTVNGDVGSVLTSSGDGGIQISEFNYTFALEGERTLMLGLIDPSAWLDRGRIANDENKHFLNGSFINNATIEFPDYTLGGVFRLLGNEQRPEFTLVVAGSDGIADLPDRSYQDLLDLNASGRGVFVGAGASWLYDRTSWRVGAWLRNDEHPVAGDSSKTENNYGVYGVYGWQYEAHAVNVRVGFANPDVSISESFVALAYQRQTTIGLFGIGAAYTEIGASGDAPHDHYAVDSEIYLRIPVLADSGHITPSIQYVEFPGFGGAEPVPGSSAVVAGLRFHWAF